MHLTSSSEHRVNWGLAGKQVKSLAETFVMRGDKVWDSEGEAAVGKNAEDVIVRDSHRLFGHAKSVAMIANS